MGRNAKIKKQRRIEREREQNLETWNEVISPTFLLETRRMILESGAAKDSCICCTKVLQEIGASVGIKIKPMVVEAFVYNAPFVAHFAEKGFDLTEEDGDSIREDGGWLVVLGSQEKREVEEGKWQGHLVAIAYPPKHVEAQPHVLDISLDQAHRPERGIFLQEPAVFPVPTKKFFEGTEDIIGIVDVGPHKMCLVYRAFPDVTSYEESPDWQRSYEASAHAEVEFVEPNDE